MFFLFLLFYQRFYRCFNQINRGIKPYKFTSTNTISSPNGEEIATKTDIQNNHFGLRRVQMSLKFGAPMTIRVEILGSAMYGGVG